MAGREFLGSQDFNYNSLPTKDMNKRDNEDRKQVGYVRLGNSGLKVSKIILGCMSYGSPEWQE